MCKNIATVYSAPLKVPAMLAMAVGFCAHSLLGSGRLAQSMAFFSGAGTCGLT